MIPKHNEIRLEALKLLSQEGAMQFRAMEMPLAKVFKLTEEEIERKYESGNGKMFLDRISWALSLICPRFNGQFKRLISCWPIRSLQAIDNRLLNACVYGCNTLQ